MWSKLHNVTWGLLFLSLDWHLFNDFFFRIGAVALELAQKVSVTLCLVTNTARKTHKDEPRQKLEASKSSVAMFALDILHNLKKKLILCQHCSASVMFSHVPTLERFLENIDVNIVA